MWKFLQRLKNCHLGITGYFPKNDRVNVGLGRLACIEGKPLWELLDEFINQHSDLKKKRINYKKGGVIPGRVNRLLAKDNCLLIGDAAGMVNPITGGGYICGFISAKSASLHCIKALKKNDIRLIRGYAFSMGLNKHILAIKCAHYLFRLFLLVYRWTHKSLYQPFFKLYIFIVHHAMRFVKVVQ